uniref:Col_cuticle_N domain-containing protein n=1 Tax=Caenorhabditis tropicalis TaxID=1561998 RepID=A0A1I7U0X7_9PELO
MVELKSLSSPKVAVPIVGIVVLIVVSTLVAIFYIRNPTVTDGLFGGGNNENNSTNVGETTTGNGTQSAMGSSSHLIQSTTPGSHEQSSTSSATPASASPATLPMTPSPDQTSTPMHAIEPVQHL